MPCHFCLNCKIFFQGIKCHLLCSYRTLHAATQPQPVLIALIFCYRKQPQHWSKPQYETSNLIFPPSKKLMKILLETKMEQVTIFNHGFLSKPSKAFNTILKRSSRLPQDKTEKKQIQVEFQTI